MIKSTVRELGSAVADEGDIENELEVVLRKYSDAITRLDKGVAKAVKELDQDGVIHRFKVSFELLWKTLKIFLEDKGIDTKSPKDSLKAAFRIGLIDDEEAFLDMLEDRNLMSHIYDQQESKRIFQRIKKSHLPAMLKLLDRLETEIQ